MRARFGLLLIFACFTQALSYQLPPDDTPANLAQEDFPKVQQDDDGLADLEQGDDYLQMEQDDDGDAGLQDDSDFLDMQQDEGEGDFQQDSDIDDGEMEQEDDGDLAFLQRSIEDDRMVFAAQDDGEPTYEEEFEALLQQDDEDDGMVFEAQDDGEGMVLAEQDGDEEGGGTAVAQWNNRWDRPLRVVCRPGQGLYRVYSVHNNGYGDRLFRWYCKRVYSVAQIRQELRPIETRLRNHYLLRRCQYIARGNRCALKRLYRNYINHLRRIRHYYYNRLYLQRYGCHWKRINNYGHVLSYKCPANSYLTGLYSRHSNHKEDRMWWALCCRTRRVCMSRCRWSGFINNWGSTINYGTNGIMTGLYSYHNRHRKDRRWRVNYCYSRKC